MEVKVLLEDFNADLTCSICLGYFRDPVTVNCGHTFCRKCLLQCSEESDATLTCPECRGVIRYSDLVPNKNLQNLSITGKALQQNSLLSTLFLTICAQHGEQEKLFCEKDQKLICDSCLLTQEHKDHQVLPFQMSADKYKEKLQGTLNILQEKVEKFKMALNNVRIQEAQCKKDFFALHYSIIREYGKMHEFLWNEEYQYFNSLEQDSENNLANLNKNEVKLTQQIQHLQRMILEIEDNLEKAPLEMLQDMKATLKKNEELLIQEPEVVSLEWTSHPFIGLREMLLTFSRAISVEREPFNLSLILPEDLKNAKNGHAPEDLEAQEERCDNVIKVLGTHMVTSGKNYWEVDVGDQTEWSVGICYDSVNTNGKISLLSEDVKALVGLKCGKEFVLWNSEEGFH
ncbi:probable E3 ubiquitin-protein ligase TRIML1, partial [Gracilinanus agilis]|uniref:probable E3 ubiquitin-protein ligase TRIML1 n=1 Tax=Gracilinanus agilis TaxID=191870 RepID=UPI001CFF517D